MQTTHHAIMLGGKQILYSLNLKDKARSLRVAVYPGGAVKVSAPKRFGVWSVERFMRLKADWILQKIESLVLAAKPKTKHQSRQEFLKYKKAALVLVRQKLEKFNTMYGFAWKRIAIKNQKTRWGSCSKSGNLNFNFKIALLPDRAAEYVVVHELCHLAQMNHSKKFWDLVAQTIPEHRKIRQQLKIISLKI